MGMSTRIEGFTPPDEKFQKMLKAYDACEEAGIDVPEEVDRFFNGEPPDRTGVRVNLLRDKTFKSAVTTYHDSDANAEGFQIDLEELAKLSNGHVKVIRFSNSW